MLLRLSLIAAIGVLLFGYGTGVISGALITRLTSSAIKRPSASPSVDRKSGDVDGTSFAGDQLDERVTSRHAHLLSVPVSQGE